MARAARRQWAGLLASIGALAAASLLAGRGLARPELGARLAEADVRAANDRFYQALNLMAAGDLAPMAEVWSHRDDVTLQDPFGGRQVGWGDVHAAFERASALTLRGEVSPADVLLFIDSDLAYVVCREVGEQIARDGRAVPVDQRATHIFRRENGGWKMVHHHADRDAGLAHALGADE